MFVSRENKSRVLQFDPAIVIMCPERAAQIMKGVACAELEMYFSQTQFDYVFVDEFHVVADAGLAIFCYGSLSMCGVVNKAGCSRLQPTVQNLSTNFCKFPYFGFLKNREFQKV
jgi:hypothetical protein